MRHPLAPPVRSWWEHCTCESTHCGYEDGDCPLCQLLDNTLPCPKDDRLGVVPPVQRMQVCPGPGGEAYTTTYAFTDRTAGNSPVTEQQTPVPVGRCSLCSERLFRRTPDSPANEKGDYPHRHFRPYRIIPEPKA